MGVGAVGGGAGRPPRRTGGKHTTPGGLAKWPPTARALATAAGAACRGRDDRGRLEPGYRADLVVWPGDDLADVPDPLAGLVLGPDRRARHVLVDGEPVVRDGGLLGAEIGALRRELARRARRLWPG